MTGLPADAAQWRSRRHRLHERSLAAVAVTVALAVAMTLCLGVGAASANDSGWKRVLSEDGINVAAREIPDNPNLEFRGVGVIQANIFQLLAIIDDSSRHCEWQANCIVSKVVKSVGEFERYIYHRVDSPWPVSDRDVVVHGTVEANIEARTVVSRFRAVQLAGHPPVSGVVRMPTLSGFYKFEALTDTSTRVTYQVVADTGGLLPAWLSNRAARKLPLGTLLGMRRQAKRMEGRYAAFHARFNPAFGGRLVEPQALPKAR